MQTIRILPHKFDDCIINNQDNTFLQDLRIKLNAIFQNLPPSTDLLSSDQFNHLSNKQHIVTHGNLPHYVIKGGGRFSTTFDLHVYRVRRAKRIQKLIEMQKLSEVVVPKKYLYEYQGHWFVVAEKLELKPKVTINQRFSQNATHQPLTPIQAKQLAYLCFEGPLEDVNEYNIVVTTNNKIAIVDTEPLNRGQKELKNWFRIIPNLKSCFQFSSSIINSANLYELCSSEAEKEVKCIQIQMFKKHLVKIAAKVAIPIILSVGALIGAIATASLPLVGIAGALVALAGVNAVIGLSLIVYSMCSYFWFRRN